MQSDLDAERLLKVGVGAGKVKIVGNIKFDRNWEPMEQAERHDWMNLLGIAPESLVWVAGSTHPGEEKILLEIFEKLLTSFPRLRLILAPRDIGRANEISIFSLKKC